MAHPEAAAAVSARLRAALQLDAACHEGVDMSPTAVTVRLREAADLSSLCLELVRIGQDSATLYRT